MKKTDEPLLVSGPKDDPQLKSVLLLLDQSGMSYKTVKREGRSKGIMLSHGGDSVSDFTHKELVEFLWAHGAKFEDS
ncbi:MAG TPA: hypothetical protein VFE25_13815 [Opitutaceae bacterium]|jgi:hypothetical protein|nr:hypothetical protein [Opitutaceae bacterium]